MTKQEPAIQVVVRSLVNWLGPDLVGEMCGLDGPAPVKRWQVQSPDAEQEVKLRIGYKVFRILRQAEGVDVARAWMFGMNPLLDDANPVTSIGEGNGEAVVAAARAHSEDPMLT